MFSILAMLFCLLLSIVNFTKYFNIRDYNDSFNQEEKFKLEIDPIGVHNLSGVGIVTALPEEVRVPLSGDFSRYDTECWYGTFTNQDLADSLK